MAVENMKKHKDLLPNEVVDLATEIALVTPTDTPLMTMILSRGLTRPASDITVSWRERELNKTQTKLQLEGAEAPDPVKSTRRTISNICQIMSRSTSISGTLAALNPLGIGDEFAAELQDRLAELKRDMEHYVISGTKAEESGATPRQMNGLLNLVNSKNVVNATSGFTAETITDAMQKLWDAGVSSDSVYLFCGAKIKRAINKFIKEEQFEYQTGSNAYGFKVDKIITEFGDVNIVLDRHMPENQILIVDINQVELRELRKTFYQPLAITGDYHTGQIINESSVVLYNTYAAAKIINVTPA